MCTISWVISLDGQTLWESNLEAFMNVLSKGRNRGKDGVWIYTNSNTLNLLKVEWNIKEKKKEILTKSLYPLVYPVVSKENDILTSIYGHNRAIPESEENNDHTQPLESENYVLVHNGIIWNDKELFPDHQGIDSGVILKLIEEHKYDSFSENVFYALNQIKGSFAVAIYDKRSREHILATNFQPLSYKISNGKLYFASLREYLQEDRNFIENSKIQELGAYQYIYLQKISSIPGYKIDSGEIPSLREEKEVWERKGLVLASGGLDTCVVAGIMKDDYKCDDLTFLHFDYWHKVEKHEQRALKDVIEAYSARFVSVKLDFLMDLFKDSPLLTGKVDTTGKGMEVNLEYVPARNLMFLSLATAYAEVNGFDYIWFWGNLSESMAYPDTTAKFITDMNSALEGWVGVNKKIQILDPLKDLLKHEIVEEGLRVNAPMNKSFSCYINTEDGKHCGQCASCRLRAIWMERNWLDVEWNTL